MAEPLVNKESARLRTACGGRGAAAFSMLELVMVLFVMGILAAVVLPRFSGTVENQRVDGAARHIASDLEQAARAAAASSASARIEFFTGSSNNYYTMPGRPDLNHPGQTYTVRVGRVHEGVVLETANFAGAAEITFNGYGVPSTSGFVVVRSGGAQRRVSLDAATGRVTVSN